MSGWETRADALAEELQSLLDLGDGAPATWTEVAESVLRLARELEEACDDLVPASEEEWERTEAAVELGEWALALVAVLVADHGEAEYEESAEGARDALGRYAAARSAEPSEP